MSSTHVYFGAEFCQTLLPSLAAVTEAARAARASGAGFSLVTPPLNDVGVAAVGALLDALAQLNDETAGGRFEVVANDWAVLRLLARTPGRFVPVLGRLLARMLRDPRLPPLETTGVAPAAALAARQGQVTSPPFLKLIRSMGVERVELDNVQQGIAIDFEALGLRPSLHLPFGFVTSGRICPFAGIGQPKEAKFSVTTSCHHECRRYAATMVDPNVGPSSSALLTVGNTVLQRQAAERVERALSWATSQRARLVVRRRPFDEQARGTEDPAQARAWMEEG